MIFLTTNQGPTQVQLWDTETRTLVKKYMFPEHMYFGSSMAVDNERLWIILIGRREYLIQLDAASGEVRVINLEIRPRIMQFIEGSL